MRYNPAITIQFWVTNQSDFDPEPAANDWRHNLRFIVTGDVERTVECVPLLASDTSQDILREVAPEDRERIKQGLYQVISAAIDELFTAEPPPGYPC